MKITEWAIDFVSNNYGKITTSALLCSLLLYKNHQIRHLKQKLKESQVQKKRVATELSVLTEKLKKVYLMKTKEHLCDVIFFEGRVEGCADHVVEKFDCPLTSCPATKIRKIVSYIDAAQSSLDICLYLITNRTLGDAILRAWKRGLVLRVISDGDMAFASGSQITRFIEKNIPVRLTGPPYIMHHKFVLIDSSLVLQGSMNWTTQACSGNYENVVITGTPGIVSAFRDHFDTLYTRLSEERQKLIKESEKISEKLSEKESWD
ncbi:hypothetical protein M8J76_014763 [Diaphorina citri]|nr:hypothetical protein M8J76_014763 [Diaphorina citri]